jgi:hypothetical protein
MPASPLAASSESPSNVDDKWSSSVLGIRAYKGIGLVNAWKCQVSRVLTSAFKPMTISAMPAEFIDILLNVDRDSLEHLWIKTFHDDPRHMSLGQMRFLIDTFLADSSDIKLTPDQYSDWIAELLLLLNADEERGIISREYFLKLFPLWTCSRLLFVPERRGVIHEIIHAWRYLDISNCGVLSANSMTNWLLPFAFRRIFAHPGSDDSALRNAWLELVPFKGATRYTEWINHWTEFSNVNSLSFVDELDTRANATGLAIQASLLLGVAEPPLSDLDNLLSLCGSSKQARSRAFSLWLVSLRHGKRRFRTSSIAETETLPKAILRLHDIRPACRAIWSQSLRLTVGNTLPESHLPLFRAWFSKIIAGLGIGLSHLTEEQVLLRDEFIGRFLTEDEVASLWERFAQTESGRIAPEELLKLLAGVHAQLKKSGTDFSPSIVEDWLRCFVKFCNDLDLCADKENPTIAKRAFMSAFPLFYATLSESLVPERNIENLAVTAVWPKAEEKEIIYAEPVLRNLLRESWAKLVPHNLNIPCQDWWLDRCVERLERRGSGVSRATFMSLFLTEAEIDQIISSVDELDLKTLGKILGQALGPESPSEAIQEFYLMVDTDFRARDLEKLATVSTESFRIAFPLWFVAHGF